jgi:hypothetical protein
MSVETKKPTRRQALRRATLLMFGMALGKLDVIKASTPERCGCLTINLDQWGEIVFTLHGRRISVPVADVFAALADERGVKTT